MDDFDDLDDLDDDYTGREAIAGAALNLPDDGSPIGAIGADPLTGCTAGPGHCYPI